MRNYELFCTGLNVNLPFHCLCNSKNFDNHLVNSLIFCVENFAIIRKIIFGNEYFDTNPLFAGKKLQKQKKTLLKLCQKSSRLPTT